MLNLPQRIRLTLGFFINDTINNPLLNHYEALWHPLRWQ